MYCWYFQKLLSWLVYFWYFQKLLRLMVYHTYGTSLSHRNAFAELEVSLIIIFVLVAGKLYLDFHPYLSVNLLHSSNCQFQRGHGSLGYSATFQTPHNFSAEEIPMDFLMRLLCPRLFCQELFVHCLPNLI